MTNKVSSKGIPFQNKCQLVLDDEIRAIYDELNPPESPLWYQFGVGQGNGTTVVIFPAECEGSYTESEYQAFLEDCSTLESVGYAIQRANFGRSEGLVVLYLRLGDGDVTGEEEGGLLEWVHQVLPAGATHLWEDIREIDSRVLQFSLPVFHSSEVEYLEKALKALQNAGWIVDVRTKGESMTCNLMAPLPGERPANVIQALSRVTWGTDYTKMLAEGTEADGMLVLDSAEVSNESMQTAFALAAKAHAQGWAVKRKSNISSGEDIITFQPPRGLIAPR